MTLTLLSQAAKLSDIPDRLESHQGAHQASAFFGSEYWVDQFGCLGDDFRASHGFLGVSLKLSVRCDSRVEGVKVRVGPLMDESIATLTSAPHEPGGLAPPPSSENV